jgi:hypothetical protein
MGRFHLYRHYDANGDLLYVGQSNNAFKRYAGHQQESDWIALSVTMRVEHFNSRENALAAEHKAIFEEKPRFNRCMVPKYEGGMHLLQMRVSERFLSGLDAWRATQTDLPTRTEAIRILTEAGIEAMAAGLEAEAKKKGGRK